MNPRFIVLLHLLVFAAIGAPGALAAPVSLNADLEPLLERHGLPAIAAAAVKNGEVVAAGAVGTRRAGSNIPVTLDDRFHLGSDTKAMTSLLAAMLVEKSKLRWDSTVGEVFPELADKMHPDLRKVTLKQLLSHSSGMPGDTDDIEDEVNRAQLRPGNLDEIRYSLVKDWSPNPLEAASGSRFIYSNVGYILVGAMIERVAEKTWEELICEWIFDPLGLKAAGLGPQAQLGRVDATLGHLLIDGKPKAFLAGPNGDNPSVMGPAGLAHMSILDFARWAGWNAGGGRRGPRLVDPELLKTLHTPVITMMTRTNAAPGTPSRGRYGLGWGELDIDWAPVPLLFHGGSNTKNIAQIWIDREADFAMVFVTNIGGEKADQALLGEAAKLYRRFVARRE